MFTVVFDHSGQFRIYNITKNEWVLGGLTEVCFGLFTDPEDGCEPRARALAIQETTGSRADLYEISKRLTEKEA